MKVKNIAISMFSIIFGVICFIWGLLWVMMCLDYKEQVGILEQEIIELEWQVENNYIYCEVE